MNVGQAMQTDEAVVAGSPQRAIVTLCAKPCRKVGRHRNNSSQEVQTHRVSARLPARGGTGRMAIMKSAVDRTTPKMRRIWMDATRPQFLKK